MAAVAPSVEYLVDLFLRDDPDLEEPEFNAEGAVDRYDGDPEDADASHQSFLWTKIGRDLKHSGDVFNKLFETVKQRSLTDDLKQLFDDQIKKAGKNPEEFWPQYRELMDNAVRDTGLDDATKVLAAVLVSVKGLGYLGSYVRTFILRYIREGALDSDFKRLDLNNETRRHPSLD